MAEYEGTMKRVLRLYKFHDRACLVDLLVPRLSQFITTHIGTDKFNTIVAVPMDRLKENDRGYNQSALLVRGLSKRLGMPDLTRHIARQRISVPLYRLGKKSRRDSMTDAFQVTSPVAFRGKQILLVDDILTTGLTASECAKSIKTAGADRVIVLACARGI